MIKLGPVTKPKLRNSMITDNEELHFNCHRFLGTVAPVRIPAMGQIVKPLLLMGDALSKHIF